MHKNCVLLKDHSHVSNRSKQHCSILGLRQDDGRNSFCLCHQWTNIVGKIGRHSQYWKNPSLDPCLHPSCFTGFTLELKKTIYCPQVKGRLRHRQLSISSLKVVPRLSKSCPKLSQTCPKLVPNLSQTCPKVAPRYVKVVSGMAKGQSCLAED